MVAGKKNERKNIMSTEAKKNPPPVAKFQLGRVQSAVWSSVSQKGNTFFYFTIQNGYRDAAGNFKNGTRYSQEEGPALAYVALKATDKIAELRAADVSDTAAEVSDADEDNIPE
jgi:hypothetical protein